MSNVYRHWKRIRGNSNKGRLLALAPWLEMDCNTGLETEKAQYRETREPKANPCILYPAYQDPLHPLRDAAIRSTRSSTFLETRETHSAANIKCAGKNNHLLCPGQRGEMYREASSSTEKSSLT